MHFHHTLLAGHLTRTVTHHIIELLNITCLRRFKTMLHIRCQMSKNEAEENSAVKVSTV